MKLKKILIGGIAAALLAVILVTAFASGGTGFTGISARSSGCGGLQGGCCGRGVPDGASGTGIAQQSTTTQAGGIQVITTTLEPYGYPALTVQKGIPVKWTITADAQNLNSCNNEIIIPAYGISKQLAAGENIIEFTPANAGVIPYSCWMGMIQSTITVVE
jgi:uncharacterized protein